MKKRYEKIAAEIVEIRQDAVSTSTSEEYVARKSMADIEDVYDFEWLSEVK